MKTENTNKFCISAIKLCMILNSLHKKVQRLYMYGAACTKQQDVHCEHPAVAYYLSLSPLFMANAILIIT